MLSEKKKKYWNETLHSLSSIFARAKGWNEFQGEEVITKSSQPPYRENIYTSSRKKKKKKIHDLRPIRSSIPIVITPVLQHPLPSSNITETRGSNLLLSSSRLSFPPSPRRTPDPSFRLLLFRIDPEAFSSFSLSSTQRERSEETSDLAARLD